MATGLYVGTYNSGTGQIDWDNRYALVDTTTLRVVDGLGPSSDSMAWSMRTGVEFVQGGEELPLSGQIVRLDIGTTRIFEGVIGQVSNEWFTGGTSIGMTAAANSYVLLLNRHLVVRSELPEEPAGTRIKSLLTEFAPDFAQNFGYIESGPTVAEDSLDYQQLSSVLSKIANSVGYMWYVDPFKQIHFFADMTHDAPIAAIDADTNTDVGELVVDQDASGISNVIILKDYASRGTSGHSHETTADGQTAFFSLPLGPFALEDTRVYVRPEGGTSWVEREVIEDPLDGRPESIAGSPGLAYLCLFNWGVRFPTSDMPGPGDQIKVDYNPEIPDRVTVVFDEDSIKECARREGGDGHHEMVVSVSDFRVTNERPITLLGELILRRKAWPAVTGSFTLRTSNYSEWMPGQTFTIISAKRDIFDVRKWVSSDYTTKDPQRVWVTRVDRLFEIQDSGIVELDTIYFTSQPWS